MYAERGWPLFRGRGEEGGLREGHGWQGAQVGLVRGLQVGAMGPGRHGGHRRRGGGTLGQGFSTPWRQRGHSGPEEALFFFTDVM